MKIILYTSNNFQNLLCLEAVKEYLTGDRPSTQEAFEGKIRIKRNAKSVTAEYLHAKDTVINFTVPKPEKDENQIEIPYENND